MEHILTVEAIEVQCHLVTCDCLLDGGSSAEGGHRLCSLLLELALKVGSATYCPQDLAQVTYAL